MVRADHLDRTLDKCLDLPLNQPALTGQQAVFTGHQGRQHRCTLCLAHWIPMTSISIPDDLAEQLASAAAARGVTVDEVAAELLAERMQAGDPPTTMAGLVGLGESGESNVSERIDEVISQRFTA